MTEIFNHDSNHIFMWNPTKEELAMLNNRQTAMISFWSMDPQTLSVEVLDDRISEHEEPPIEEAVPLLKVVN